MRQVKEVLRLCFEQKRTHREIALGVGLGKSSVTDDLARAKAVGLTWEQVQSLTEQEIESGCLHRRRPRAVAPRADRHEVGAHELRKPGVTLQLLCTEYQEGVVARKDGTRPYQYSQFCDLYQRWRRHARSSMRQVHRAGEKLFVDYSGKKPAIVDPITGEVTEVELFVAVLGASNYTYAEATRTQKMADFVGSTIRAFEYFGRSRSCSCPTSSAAPSAGPIGTSRRSTRRISSWPSTTASR